MYTWSATLVFALVISSIVAKTGMWRKRENRQVRACWLGAEYRLAEGPAVHSAKGEIMQTAEMVSAMLNGTPAATRLTLCS